MLHLIEHLLNRARHHVAPDDRLIGAEHILRAIVAVDVGGGEVDGHVVLRAVGDQVVHPGSLSGRRTANAKPRANSF